MKQTVKNFNNLIKKTIFKVGNKTNNKFQISVFNKYIISFISILFVYIFYLLIPLLYDKNWLQDKIISELKNKFNISLSDSIDISYRILPKPHFLVEDTKIPLAEIEKIKIFISQNNFFNKENTNIIEVIINGANFSFLNDDIKKLYNDSENKLSDKKIKIKNSNIFFKDNFGEVISIIKISNALLFFDEKNSLNSFNLKGEVFNIPFKLGYKFTFNSTKNKRTEIEAADIRLKIINEIIKIDENSSSGTNIVSILSSIINTKYNIEDEVIFFESNNSRVNNSKINYNGRFAIKPFDLNLKINLKDYKIFNLISSTSTLNEFIKSGLLFNENISVNTLINIKSKIKDNFFHNAKIELKILNGRMNFDNTIFINDDIGLIKVSDSDLFLKNDKLTLIANLSLDIKDSDKLFSFLKTSKKSRKNIKNVRFNIIYDFLSNQIEFKNIKVNDNEVSDQLLYIIEKFSDNNSNNFNKSRRLLNELINLYEG